MIQNQIGDKSPNSLTLFIQILVKSIIEKKKM